jgi:hypothetical protein
VTLAWRRRIDEPILTLIGGHALQVGTHDRPNAQLLRILCIRAGLALRERSAMRRPSSATSSPTARR